MSTFTIRVTSSATNVAGTAYGQQPDLGSPSFMDLYITGSTDPLLPNGQYDAYCLNPLVSILASPTTYTAENLAGNSAASFVPIGFSALSQTQVDQVNWLLSQNFTADAKYGGQYNFGEVQTAIWKLVGFTDAQISGAHLDRFVSDNGRNVVSTSDIDFLISSAQSAVASGNGVVPTNAFFSTVIDPAGNVQPLIVQLQSAKLGNYVWSDDNANGLQDSGEAGVDKVVVELYSANGTLIATTSTGDDYSTAAVEHGFYQFAGLQAGDYQVKFIAPSYNFTVADAAGNSQDAVDSDANAANGLSHMVTLAAGQSDQTVDAGLVAKPANASLSGYVYEDFGNDGLRGAGEPALAGVTVTLTGVDNHGNVVTASMVTDTQGFYAFTGLAAGTYTVTESQPVAYLDGRDTAGSNGGSTVVNDVISNVVLAAGDNSVNNNFGELVGAQIRGTVYCDDNNNGTQQAGELGLAGVTITLTGTDDRGNPVTASTVTAADGSYIFAGLRPGIYSVTEPTQPAGKLNGIDSAGLFGGGTAGNDVITNIVLTQGLISDNNNFGEIKPASVSGFVYVDAGDDGIKGAGETPIAGVTVTLTGTDDRNQPVLLITVTGADGSYTFGDLRPGSYSVTESQPAAYLDGKDTAGTPGDGVVSNDKISNITLASGENSVNNNFGELPKLNSISGVVFEDKNNDGIKDPAEAGIPGATVTLTGTDAAGNPVSLTTTTGADGSYSFNGVPAGNYTVTETQPAGYLDGKDSGGNSGGSVTDDKVANISLPVGVVTPVTGVNFGEQLAAMLSGFVYVDAGDDGIKGVGETPIAGVSVTLSGTDNLGNAVTGTTTTNAQGFYEFAALRPGSYSVTESQPAAYLDGKDTAGTPGDGVVSNDKISNITLASGENSVNNNFGELPPAGLISGVVYCDNNNDGIQQAGDVGLGGVPVRLQGTNDRGQAVDITINTNADGSYAFTGLRPGTYSVTETVQPAGKLDGKETAGSTGGNTSVNDVISNIVVGAGQSSTGNNFGELLPAKAHIGDLVFEDKNANGLQDAGEAGIGNVTVNLCDANGNVVGTTTTDAAGKYGFDVAAGTYSVQVVAPANYLITAKDTGGNTAASDLVDSDIAANGKTGNYVLAAGDVNNSVDAGLYRSASLGDKVWVDIDKDGVQDANEPGVAGVKVYLLDAAGATVGSPQTSNGAGEYLFTNLTPGTYSVHFDLATLPAGYSVSLRDAAAATDASDSDADPLTGRTAQTTLDSGEIDRSWDMGIQANVGIDIEKYVHGEYMSPGATGGEGLTPGFWKNHTGFTSAPLSGWPETGLTPNTSYESIFGVNVPSSAPTLLDALSAAGGGMDALLRHSTAALLNTSNPYICYAYTKAQIVAMVQQAFASGEYETPKNLLATQNELGADLNTPSSAGATLVVTPDVDADTAGSGPVIPAGGTAVFTYVVKNTGSTALSNISLSDDRIASLAFVGGDTNNDNKLDVTETWVYKASELVQASGQQVNIGTAIGIDAVSGVQVSDRDAAYYGSAAPGQTLGDRVWLDTNANGIQDAGELGIAGVTVLLKNTAGTVLQTTTTNASGNYLFDVDVGSYRVSVVTPTGYAITAKDRGGDDRVDSDIDATTETTGTITVAAGQQNLSVDAGLVTCQIKLGDRVWIDANNNGVQDAGEKGLAGVKVALIGAGADGALGTADDTSRSTTTDANGLYLFDKVEFGTYKVRFDAGANYVVTKSNIGDDALDSDVVAAVVKGSTNLVSNGSFESGTTGWTGSGDVVEVNTATVFGVTGATGLKVAELDANVCGTTGFYQAIQTTAKQTYELSVDIAARSGTALATNTVEVFWAGSKIATIDPTSTTMKTYSFTVTGTGGADKLEFREQAGDDDSVGGIIDNVKLVTCTTVTETAPIIVNACVDNLTIDAGLVSNFKPAIDVEKYVSSTLTTTNNNNGGEGADCSYWKSSCSTTSSSNWVSTGWYGGYWATTTTPNGWTGVGGCTGKESFNSVFGVNCTGGSKSIYDVLCSTGTGSQDKLMRECVSAYLNACHDKVDYAYSKDQVCAQGKYAIESGKYDETCNTFSRENSSGCNFSTSKGTYSCAVDTQLYDADAPPGLEVRVGSTVTFTYIVKNTGDTALKNVVLVDDRIATVTYVSGDTDRDGLLDTTETWTYTANEVAASGTIKNTGTVTAVDAVTGSQAVTDKDDAYYTGKGTVATKGSIGDKVFEDKNFNGLQDAGEAAVAGIKVTLKGAGVDGVFGSRDDITATTTTLAGGAYEFNDLVAGKYQLVFADTTGKGYQATKANQGADDSKDSDIDSTGATGVITLAAGEHNLTVDAGVYLKATVGDKVFEDKNHNNIQDVGESGIGGVKVQLLNSAGNVLASTTTNTAGNYQFSNIDPGSYMLQFDKSNVMYAGVNMNLWKWAVKDTGSNDAIDSDVKGDAYATTNLTKTDLFSLTSGQSDQTRDAGITPIVIDLDGNGIQTIARADSNGSFDLFGNGAAVKSGWISSGDGFLAVDNNGNGKIDDISELFGGNAKGAGFANLASYDSNHDGLVNSLDADFGKLMIWQDANGNHSTDAGELMGLAQAGVASLTVAYTELPFIDAQGNMHLERSTATLDSGASVDMTDVYFNVDAADAKAAGVALPTMADLLGDDRAMDVVVGGSDMASTCQVKPADEACSANAGDAGDVMRRLAALTREDHHAAAA